MPIRLGKSPLLEFKMDKLYQESRGHFFWGGGGGGVAFSKDKKHGR